MPPKPQGLLAFCSRISRTRGPKQPLRDAQETRNRWHRERRKLGQPKNRGSAADIRINSCALIILKPLLIPEKEENDYHRCAKQSAAQTGKDHWVMAGVRIVEAPREIKSFPYFMAWHSRLTNEPAHKWFRGQLRSAVRTSEQFEAQTAG
jgi:hypothetical protein